VECEGFRQYAKVRDSSSSYCWQACVWPTQFCTHSSRAHYRCSRGHQECPPILGHLDSRCPPSHHGIPPPQDVPFGPVVQRHRVCLAHPGAGTRRSQFSTLLCAHTHAHTRIWRAKTACELWPCVMSLSLSLSLSLPPGIQVRLMACKLLPSVCGKDGRGEMRVTDRPETWTPGRPT
jgi:hypothetical protein